MAAPSTASAVYRTHSVSRTTVVQLSILQSMCSAGHQHATCINLGPAFELGGASSLHARTAQLSCPGL